VSVTVVLPGQLRDLVGGRSTIRLEGSPKSVEDALEALRRTHPQVWDRVLTEQRQIRPHVNVFVGTEDIRWSGGLDTPVPDGSELVILPSVSGG
jgi:MoaD family protein